MAKKEEKFDVVIIGAGQAGIFACKSARAQKKSVCVIEEDRAGGECPWDACIPSKAMLASAKRYLDMRFSEDLGLQCNPTFDFKAIMHRTREVVRAATGGGHRFEGMIEQMGATYIKGRATFVDSHVVDVGGKKIRGKAFVIATGGKTYIPSIKNLDEADIWTFKDVVQAKKLPHSLLIIGGGPVGVEFATFFVSLGVQVTMIEKNKEILNNVDPEIAAIARKLLNDLGVQIFTSSVAVEIQKKLRAHRVIFERNGDMHHIDAGRILLATGKRPNIDGLGLDDIGVKMSDGQLKINKNLQTSQRHIFVAGDVANGPQYTNYAHYAGALAGNNAASSLKRTPRYEKVDDSIVPGAIFMYPEIAHVGMTAQQAKDAGKGILVGKSHHKEVWRANTDGIETFLCKIIIDEKTDRIIGATIIGPHAGEIIHEIVLAMKFGIKANDLAQMIHVFPTLSESIVTAINNAK